MGETFQRVGKTKGRALNEIDCYFKLYGNLIFCVPHYEKNFALDSTEKFFMELTGTRKH